MPMTLTEKAAAYHREQRLFTVLQMLGNRLIKEGVTWSEEERKAYDWAWHELTANMNKLAA